MKSDKEKLRELRWELFKLKGGDMSMRYVKILLMAVVEVISELYNNKKG
jgi:hypothetical protein